VRLTPGDGKRVAWWTVRVLEGGAWRSWVLPGAQRRLVVSGVGETGPIRVLVTAVDRYGTESVVVTARQDGQD